MVFSSIHFFELKNFSDCESLVFTGLLLTEADMPEVNEFFHSHGLIPEGKNLTGAYHILDNVMGEDGRSDFLLTFDRPDMPINIVVRMEMSSMGIKWTSDFIDNCASDYPA